MGKSITREHIVVSCDRKGEGTMGEETVEAKQVIVVRKDLNMRKGKIAAQVAHASMGAVLKKMKQTGSDPYFHLEVSYTSTTSLGAWLLGPFTKICVGCDTLDELLALVEQAKKDDILHCLITDAGKTEFNGVPTITCAAFGPEWCDKLDNLTGHLKLL